MTVVLPEGVGALWRVNQEQIKMGIASVLYQTSSIRSGSSRPREEHGHGDDDSNETEWDPEKYMGMAMISGFLVMFL